VTIDVSDLTDFQSGDAQTHLDLALAVVRAYCGWHIAPSQEDTVTLDGAGTTIQALPSLHVTAVESVEVDGEAVDTGNFTWSAAGFLRYGGECWPGRWSGVLRDVVVTFTHGYAELPAEIRAVVLSVAARSSTSPSGASTMQAGPYSVALGRNADGSSGGVTLTDLERAVLDRYRLPALS
jgi:hypothetical protein